MSFEGLFNRIHTERVKRKFRSIGNNCMIPRRITIINPDRITLGERVIISSGSHLQAITEYFGIKYSPSISIGNNVLLMRNVCIYCANNVSLEDNVVLSSDVFITDENHGTNPTIGNYLNQFLVTKSVRIKKGAWLGQKVSVMSGVTIGENSIIGAGSVVTRNIPDNSIAVGVPAKVIKMFSNETGRWENYVMEE